MKIDSIFACGMVEEFILRKDHMNQQLTHNDFQHLRTRGVLIKQGRKTIELTLSGLQQMMTFNQNTKKPKVANILDDSFFIDFLSHSSAARELYIQYQPLCRGRTIDDMGLSPAHSLMFYFAYEHPSLWFSAIQDGNTAFAPDDMFFTKNALVGGAFSLPGDDWALRISLPSVDAAHLRKNHHWYENVLRVPGTSSE